MFQKEKNYNYYEYFVKMAGFAQKASGYLKTALAEFDPEEIEEIRSNMHAIEHEADMEKHTMCEQLLKEFLPPIDRDDLMDLSDALDDLIDDIEEVILKIFMYNVRSIREDAIALADIVDQNCIHLVELMKHFSEWKKKMPAVKQSIIEVNHSEEEGDQLYIRSMRTLYCSESQAVVLDTWREIFNALEGCCDACEHVADAVEVIMMKNA